jgi:hypothetical protein
MARPDHLCNSFAPRYQNIHVAFLSSGALEYDVPAAKIVATRTRFVEHEARWLNTGQHSGINVVALITSFPAAENNLRREG